MNRIAHPAQADNLPTQTALVMLEQSVLTLHRSALSLAVPTRCGKAQISRELAGVIATLETIRMALK